ncbi:hypothetical protein VPH35_133681 [Triticum aestivum]
MVPRKTTTGSTPRCRPPLMSSSRRHGGWRHGARHRAARRLPCHTEEMPFEMETYGSPLRPSPTSSRHRGRSSGACLDAARGPHRHGARHHAAPCLLRHTGMPFKMATRSPLSHTVH